MSAKGQQFLRYDEEIVKDVDRAYVDYLEQNIEKVFEGIDIVIISDYGKGNVTCDTAQTLIRKAREEDIPVIVDQRVVITKNIQEQQLVHRICLNFVRLQVAERT